MTVRELIRHLRGFPKDMLVVVEGYEQGFDDPLPPSRIQVVDAQGPGEKQQKYYGRYEWDEGGELEVVAIGRPAGEVDAHQYAQDKHE